MQTTVCVQDILANLSVKIASHYIHKALTTSLDLVNLTQVTNTSNQGDKISITFLFRRESVNYFSHEREQQ